MTEEDKKEIHEAACKYSDSWKRIPGPGSRITAFKAGVDWALSNLALNLEDLVISSRQEKTE